MRSKRSASFGYGNKIDISLLADKNPAPGSYNAKSDFESSPKKKSIILGLGRSVTISLTKNIVCSHAYLCLTHSYI